MPFQLRADVRVVRPQDGAYILGIQRLGAVRKADQIAEENRGNPALVSLPRAVERALMLGHAVHLTRPFPIHS
jgi:hypothetical protein